MIKLIAIDLDGTLLRSDSQFSKYTIETIKKAVCKGIIIVPNSGRSMRNIRNKVAEIPGLRYGISSNGAMTACLDTLEELDSRKIPPKAVYKIYQRVKELNGFMEVYVEPDSFYEKGTEETYYACGMSIERCKSIIEAAVPVSSLDEKLKEGDLAVNKLHIAFGESELRKRIGELCIETGEADFAYPSPFNMEVFPKNCNKDTAISLIARREGIARNEIMAIGDSDNDLAMIRYAEVGVAVKNAMEHVKTAADIVIGSNDEDGPAHLLENLIDNENIFRGERKYFHY